MQSSPAVEQQYKELTRGYQTALDSYNDLQKKRDDSAMAAESGDGSRKGSNFACSIPPIFRTSLHFRIVLCLRWEDLAAAWVSGLAIAFLLEMRDSSFKTERDVEFALHLPVLAMVPEIEPISDKEAKAWRGSTHLADSRIGSGARA